MSGNCDVVVIDKKFDVESLGNCEPCSFSIVTFLLRTIRAKAEDDLVAVSERNSVDKRPYMRYPVRKWLTRVEKKVQKHTTYVQVALMRI